MSDKVDICVGGEWRDGEENEPDVDSELRLVHYISAA